MEAKKIHHHIIASHGFISLWSLPELWRRRSERQRPPPHSPPSARCYFNSSLTRRGARRFFSQSCSLNAPLLRPTRCQSAAHTAEETRAGVVRPRTRFVATERGGRNRSHRRLNDCSQMDRTSEKKNLIPLLSPMCSQACTLCNQTGYRAIE